MVSIINESTIILYVNGTKRKKKKTKTTIIWYGTHDYLNKTKKKTTVYN